MRYEMAVRAQSSDFRIRCVILVLCSHCAATSFSLTTILIRVENRIMYMNFLSMVLAKVRGRPNVFIERKKRIDRRSTAVRGTTSS